MKCDFNPKIPILMYHEVSGKSPRKSDSFHKLTPLYDISTSKFESQMRFLHENGYKSLRFEEAPLIEKNGKYVLITFDDGLKGNIEHALPVLKKYGFTATIFLAVSRISTDRFMNWPEVIEMSRQGISIQSHTLSHNPLQNLTEDEIFNELSLSKQIIENQLHTTVSVLSFPHGSYNKKVVRIARQIGYRFMCSSDIERVCYNSFSSEAPVLGRIAMTNTVDLDRFARILEYNNGELLRRMIAKKSKNMLKSLIGINNYRSLYRRFFNIKQSS